MNLPIPIRHGSHLSKRCYRKACKARIWRSNYVERVTYDQAKHCSRACANEGYAGLNWSKLMDYQVVDGESMTLDEIARVAGTSRERIRQIEALALRRLALRAQVMRLREYIK